MKVRTIAYYLFLLFHLGIVDATDVMAQDNSELRNEVLEARPFDDAVWGKLNEELDYSGEAPIPQEVEEEKEKEETDFEFPTLPLFLQLILLGTLLGLLSWLIYSVIRADDRKKIISNIKAADSNKENITLKRLEEELDKNDVFPLLFQAEQDKDYHLAVRLHFLALLKKLHTNGVIHWKKDLTNRAYLRQMRSQERFPEFRKLTQTFERVWYGHQVPNESEYIQIKHEFNAFKPVSEPVNTSSHE